MRALDLSETNIIPQAMDWRLADPPLSWALYLGLFWYGNSCESD